MSSTISTVFILAFSLFSSYFALSLCRIGAFDFLFVLCSLRLFNVPYTFLKCLWMLKGQSCLEGSTFALFHFQAEQNFEAIHQSLLKSCSSSLLNLRNGPLM